MEKIKSITFDIEAQNALPKHIKDKMRKDRKEAEAKQLLIPRVVKSLPDNNLSKNESSGVYGRPDWVDEL